MTRHAQLLFWQSLSGRSWRSELRFRVLPTCVGMVRISQSPLLSLWRLPHGRGDGLFTYEEEE